jgi:ribonucleotide monophosphatase NagD (HAD superfamily)
MTEPFWGLVTLPLTTYKVVFIDYDGTVLKEKLIPESSNKLGDLRKPNIPSKFKTVGGD